MLDFRKLSTYWSELLGEAAKGQVLQTEHVALAEETLAQHSSEFEKLCAKCTDPASRLTWLIGLPLSDPKESFPLPKFDPAYKVVASDGSGFPLSRHQALAVYLINIGLVALTYGEQAQASLSSTPELFFKDADLSIGEKAHKRPITSGEIDLKRDLRELQALQKFVDREAADLVLVDGSLVRWQLPGDGSQFEKEYLRDYIANFTALQKARVPIAAYISLSGSSEGVNFLRLALCPYEPPNCDRCPDLPCNKIAGVLDRMLFGKQLKPGERTCLFASRSKILQAYGEHQIFFFYLNVGSEIARVEIPRYVAEDEKLLNQVHALLWDQVSKGHGYPIALQEAHEQAVVGNSERELFFATIERELMKNGQKIKQTAKSLSKRQRIV